MTYQENMLPAHMQQFAEKLNRVFEKTLEAQKTAGAPERLVEAMSYAMLGAGKRLRPFVLAQTAGLFGRQDQGVLLAGCALECMHGYSLIHDDLPCMDNDDLRRGKPTLHKAFDEATAILAGDALQSLAFELLTNPQVEKEPAKRLKLVQELTCAAGSTGMAGGQMLDLAAEGRFLQEQQTDIQKLQNMKTGALFRFACVAGALLGGASKQQTAALARYGEKIGAAFQLADDLLDHTGQSAIVGKRTAKDKKAGKATWLDALSLTEAQNLLKNQITEAQSALSPFGKKAGALKAIATFIAKRTF